jgi:multidrug efflux pump subunit AcrB
VQRVKAALPDMQAVIPEDIKVSYEFDQSGYVINSLKSLLFEGGLGAILTGLMVLLFLGDRRGALIVVMTIPLALLSSATLLYLAGQTINIMTLGGLALSVGILVDEATVTIENIHRHLEMGKSKAKAIADASKEIATPKLLILLSILAVFVPSLFMSGVPRAMFLPLSLAVGFAMIASFILSQTFVPVVSNWLMKHHLSKAEITTSVSTFNRLKAVYRRSGERIKTGGGLVTLVFVLVSVGLIALLFSVTGTQLFPSSDTGQTQVRLRLPVGTRLERTEEATRTLLSLVDNIAGKENVEITSAFIGTQPSSFPVNYLHLWTGGPNESITRIKLKSDALPIEAFKEQLRDVVKKQIPNARISFEPGDLAEQVLNLGSTNPVQIAVLNRNLEEGKKTATQLLNELSKISSLRDLQIATPLDYPAIKIDVDRIKAGQLNITSDQVARSAVAATSSSRFTSPSYWLDKSTGTAYIIQVQYPEYRMKSTSDLEMIPIASNGTNVHLLHEVASWKRIPMVGEYDRLNQQRYITVTANVHNEDLGSAFKKVNQAISNVTPPKGSKILLRGQPELLQETLKSLQFGLLIAVVVIFLLMAVFFQSFPIAAVTLSVIPAVIAGSLLMLFLTGQTMNIQSYMGTIMAIGVSIANAVLFITNAEELRRADNIANAHFIAAESRLRPILMTSLAMIAGMVPMAIGFGESGDQTAPLGIAVIGGLIFSTISVLFFLPHVYRWGIGRKRYASASMDPLDENSKYFNEQ